MRDAKWFRLQGRRLVARSQDVTPVDVDGGVFSLRLLPSAGVTPSGSYDPLCYEVRNLLGVYVERHRRNWERIRSLLVRLEEDTGAELVGVSERVRGRLHWATRWRSTRGTTGVSRGCCGSWREG